MRYHSIWSDYCVLVLIVVTATIATLNWGGGISYTGVDQDKSIEQGSRRMTSQMHS